MKSLNVLFFVVVIDRSPQSQLKTSSSSYSWNFGKIPRIRAEQLLFDELVGTFLIRESEHYPGDLSLSIKDDAKIQHYRVKLDPIRHTYTVDDEIFFPDLRLLVEVKNKTTNIFCYFSSSSSLFDVALRIGCRWFVLSIGKSFE